MHSAMNLVSVGFIAAAVVLRWYPVVSIALVIFSATWLGISFTPREKHIEHTYQRLPSRDKFLASLPTVWPDGDGAECAICMEAFEKPDRLPCQLPCKHFYCRPCLDLLFTTQAAQHRCPECQFSLFRPIPAWKHFLAKVHICSNMVGIVCCSFRFVWDVVMLLRVRRSIFNIATFVTLADLTGILPIMVVGYWPYFMSSGRDGAARESMVYNWLRWGELSIQAPSIIRKVWLLQGELAEWWTAEMFIKTPDSYVALSAVHVVTETLFETATETVTIMPYRGAGR